MKNALPSMAVESGVSLATTTEKARSLAVTAEEFARGLLLRTALERPIQQLRQQLAETPLAEMTSQSDADEVRVLAHAIDLNDAAIDFLFKTACQPLELAYAVALVTQKSFHTFTDPITGGRVKNLAGAKRAGTFFTPPSVAVEMAEMALAGRTQVAEVLEPAAGSAMLSAALLVVASNRAVPIRSVYAWELSPYLARIAERVLKAVAFRLQLSTSVHVEARDAIELFNEDRLHPDLVLLNPPYGRVKYLRSEATNAETKASNVQAAVAAGREWVDATRARYSSLVTRVGLRERGLDHQRVFMAASFAALTPSGRMVCIAPSAWTSGAQSQDLRKILLSGRHVSKLVMYSEDSKLFPTVNQPTAVVAADRHGGHVAIEVTATPAGRSRAGKYTIAYEEILNNASGTLAIPLLSAETRSAYEQVRTLPRISDRREVKNARGELDLTFDSWMLTPSAEGTRVIRGDHIDRYQLIDAESSLKPGRISAAGIEELRQRPKWADVMTPRIVGRQVSYMGKQRRLTFALVPSGAVVANSCNYLAVEDATTRNALLGYVNSAPAEWWFRVHNSNNHVSNGELGALPWPLDDQAATEAIAASAAIRGRRDAKAHPLFSNRVDAVIDALVCLSLGLNSHNARAVLRETVSSSAAEAAVALLDWFRRWGIPRHLRSVETWLQHEPNTLSALDREMISHIPVGGNWQNIPESVPSERVKQIRAMSAERGIVRTTYYGRLRPDQPAYTIATYYNRPGNGTNIHPAEDRTLSNREAARLQSFPDTYGFIGGDGAIRKQIGNAVPPLLAQAVARRIFEVGVDRGPVVDLFAGAGGLSLGFELAGADVAVAADNDESALKTYAFNRATEPIADPSSARTLLIGADLSSQRVREEVFAAVRQKLGTQPPSVLVGGPPCQGFSYAGFRDPTDPRSDLAVAFLDFVDALRPEAVVLENVEGLLTAQRGQVAKDLIGTLRELGYPVEQPWVLAAEQFGVPQMRRRVFLVARRGESISAPDGMFDRCLGRRELADAPRGSRYPITTREAIQDLPAIGDSEWPGVVSSRTEFASWARGGTEVAEFLS